MEQSWWGPSLGPTNSPVVLVEMATGQPGLEVRTHVLSRLGGPPGVVNSIRANSMPGTPAPSGLVENKVEGGLVSGDQKSWRRQWRSQWVRVMVARRVFVHVWSPVPSLAKTLGITSRSSRSARSDQGPGDYAICVITCTITASQLAVCSGLGSLHTVQNVSCFGSWFGSKLRHFHADCDRPWRGTQGPPCGSEDVRGPHLHKSPTGHQGHRRVQLKCRAFLSMGRVRRPSPGGARPSRRPGHSYRLEDDQAQQHHERQPDDRDRGLHHRPGLDRLSDGEPEVLLHQPETGVVDVTEEQ
jgi:hypothetical protein